MRAADADILIIPGLLNSGPDHWQSRWQQRLSTARRVEQKSWDSPNRDAWVDAITREATRSTRPVVCIAHSLGVAALLHASQEAGGSICGAFLVAPPSELTVRELPAVDAAFLPYPRTRLPFPATLIGSATDPYADAAFARALAADIGARFIDAGDSGHINVESGHGPWPEGSLALAHFIADL